MRRLAPVALALVLFVPCAGAWTWPVRGPLLETFSFDPADPYAAGQHRGIAIGADAARRCSPRRRRRQLRRHGADEREDRHDRDPCRTRRELDAPGLDRRDERRVVVEGAAVGTAGASGTAEFDCLTSTSASATASNTQGYLDPLSFLPSPCRPVDPRRREGRRAASRCCPGSARGDSRPRGPACRLPSARLSRRPYRSRRHLRPSSRPRPRPSRRQQRRPPHHPRPRSRRPSGGAGPRGALRGSPPQAAPRREADAACASGATLEPLNRPRPGRPAAVRGRRSGGAVDRRPRDAERAGRSA